MITQEPDILPSNVEAERVVLGLIIQRNELAHLFGVELNASDFSLDSHRRIFAAQQRLADDGKPIEYIPLEEELRIRGELEFVGGSGYIRELTEFAIRGMDPAYYSQKIREKAALRSLIHLSNSAIASAQEPGASADECRGELIDRLFEIEARTERRRVKNSSEINGDVIQHIEKLSSTSGRLVGLTTGVEQLDSGTFGIGEGELWVIGARPGQGKTSLARQIVRANLSSGVPVLFYSLEMPAKMLRIADLAAVSGVNFGRIRSGFCSKEEYAKLLTAAGEMSSWPLFVSEDGNWEIRELVAHAMMMVRQCRIKLIIVDHLQIVKDREHKDRILQVSNISNKLRVLAKTSGVPVVLLSQLSRPKDGDLSPKLWHLKESGDVEANAHTVVMPYLPEEGGKKTHEDQLLVAKQRYGDTGMIPVYFRPDRLDFAERELSA